MRRAALVVLAAMAAAACQGTLGPGDTVEGNWMNADARLVATHHVIEYSARCQHATFGPVALDGQSGFVLQSLTFEQGGNIRPTPGMTLEIHGSLVGETLHLQLLKHDPARAIPDSISMDLTAGSAKESLVCNA